MNVQKRDVIFERDFNEEIKEKIKSFVNLIESLTDTIEEKFQDGSLDSEYSKGIFDYLNKERHDIFMSMVQISLGREPDPGDVNLKDAIIDSLRENEMEEKINFYNEIFSEVKYSKILRKTPDIVLVSIEDKEITKITVIDVTVTRDAGTAVSNKIDKYRPFKQINIGSKIVLGVVYLDLNDRTSKSFFDLTGDEPAMEEIEVEKMIRAIEKAEDLKMLIKSKLNNSDLNDLNNWLKHGMTEEDLGKGKIEQFDFGINFNEFSEALNKTKFLKMFFSQLSPRNKDLMSLSMRKSRIRESDLETIDKIEKLINLKSMGDIDIEKKIEELEREVSSEAYTYQSKNRPSEPMEDTIKEGLKVLFENAKRAYEPTKKPKLLNPISLNFAIDSDLSKREKGLIVKKRRMLRFYNALEESGDKSDIVKAIKLILKPSLIGDKLYEEEFIKGNVYIREDGTTIKKEDFINEIRGTKDKTRINDPEILFDNRMAAVSYKKGEVISVRPSNLREIKELLSTAGVGRKIAIEDRGSVIKSKIKSLEFWDQTELNDHIDEFEIILDDMERNLVKIGSKINHKEFEEFDSEELSSDDSYEEKRKDAKERNRRFFERGMKYFLRHNEILWENLSFTAHMGGNGFRLIGGITDNTFLIMFPSESILKGETSVPFIQISIQEKGDIYMDFCDVNAITIPYKSGKIHITKGRRVNRSVLSGYLKVKPMYYSAVAIINSHRLDSKQAKMSLKEQTLLALIMSNININTSSLIDNVRYMVENCMADYSFCREFIEDKFMVPVKNYVQAFLFKRTVELLESVRTEMTKVRVRKALVDSEGEVNIETARVMNAEFSSIIGKYTKYNKPEYLLSEIYTLFFSVPKGLHGHFHNLLEIHKTPIEIQNNINKEYGKGRLHKIPISEGFPKQRYEFDPRLVILSCIEAEKNLTESIMHIRNTFEAKEFPHHTPLRTKTNSSTRSTLILDKRTQKINEAKTQDLESNPSLDELNSEDMSKVQSKIWSFYEQVYMAGKKDMKREWKKFLNEIESEEFKLSKEGAKKQLINFMNNKIKVNFDTRQIEYKLSGVQNDYKWKLDNLLMSEGKNKMNYYTSGTVLTEVLKDVLSEENNDRDVHDPKKLESVSHKAKKSVLSEEEWLFAIRKKGQRTQKDREIYVVTLPMKFSLYIVEHFFKQICYSLDEEKISEPGDMKIISMEKQVKNGFGWMAKKLMNVSKECEGTDQLMRGDCFHLNFDMTKWSAKDNVFKFIYMIAINGIMTIEEKMFMFLVIGKMADKKMYLDEELMYKLKVNSKKVKEGNNLNETESELFSLMTDDFNTNKISIVENWLQGQLNYCSSWIHGGAALLWKRLFMKRWSQVEMRIMINVHSDDEQIDVYNVRDSAIEEEGFIMSMWDILDFCLRSCCIEISAKKSNISRIVKQFVSQYNIAGEQIYLWSKPLMASISGCPYTTLKDDISSLMSKVSEAVSKGAPKIVARIVIEEMRSHLWNLYGVREKKMGNMFASMIGIDEKWLPSCLGGSNIIDFTTLAIGGPKTQDQMILMELLKSTGATTELSPTRVPKGVTERAIKLFYLLDVLTSEVLMNDEDPTATTSLNPFKPTKFKSRRMGKEDPFTYWENRVEQIKAIKDQNIGLGLIKPNSPRDLLMYYMVLYNNQNFKASLAGQSPTMLYMQKIINRKKGIFRLKDTGNINNEKIRDNLRKDVYTAKEISEMFSTAISTMGLSLDMIDHLRLKYIVCDPEFRVLSYVQNRSKQTSAIVKKNPVPKMKPSPLDYSVIVNPIPKLLCYFFDEDYFERNDFKIQHKIALSNDILKLNGMFPIEFEWLRSEIRENVKKRINNVKIGKKENSDIYYNYKNYQDEVEKLKRNESDAMELEHFMKRSLSGVRSVEGIIEKILTEEIKVERKGEDITELEPTTVEEEQETTKSFDIYSRLVNCSKLIDTRTKKVIFCSPTRSNDLHDITLSMKQSVESSGGMSVGYYLSSNQQQEIRGLKIGISKPHQTMLLEYGMQLANLVYLMGKLNSDETTMRNTVISSSFKGITINDLITKYKEMPRTFKRQLIFPLGIAFKEKLGMLVSKLDPMSIQWVIEQTLQTPDFFAVIHYENMIIEIKGFGIRVDEILIKYYGEIRPFFLNKAIKMFLSDLQSKDRTKTRLVGISQYIQTRPIRETDRKKPFGYSSKKNEIIKASDRFCDEMFKIKVNIIQSEEPKIQKSIHAVNINVKMMEIYYMFANGDQSGFTHRQYRDYPIVELEFEDTVIGNTKGSSLGFMLKDLAKGRMYRNIMNKRLYDNTLEDVIDYYNDPEDMAIERGTWACHYLSRLVFGDERTHKIRNDITTYLDDGIQDDLNEHMSDHGELDALMKIRTKEKDWDTLMSYVQQYDLRSVKKAMLFIKTKEVIEQPEKSTTYDEQMNDMLVIDEMGALAKIKSMEEEKDLVEEFLDEAQITNYSEDDKVMFRICAMMIMQGGMKQGTFIKALGKVTRKRGLAKKRVIVGLLFTMAHEFISFFESNEGNLLELRKAKTFFDEQYKSRKYNLSSRIMVMCNMIKEAWEEYSGDMVDESDRDIMTSLLMSASNGKKRRKNGKKDKKQEKDTAAIRKAKKSMREQSDSAGDNVGILLEITERSKIFSDNTDTATSGTDTDNYMRKRIKRGRTIEETAKDITYQRALEINEEDFFGVDMDDVSDSELFSFDND